MPKAEINSRRAVALGAAYGLGDWTVYAVVEGTLVSLVPIAFQPAAVRVQAHAGLTILLFGIYPLVGLALGAMTGRFVHVLRQRFPRLAAVPPQRAIPAATRATVILAFWMGLLVHARQDLSTLAFAVVIQSLVLAILFATFLGIVRSERLIFLSNRWLVALSLVGLSWLCILRLGEASWLVRSLTVVGASTAAALASLGIRAAVERWGNSSARIDRPDRHRSQLWLPFTAALLVVALSILPSPEPRWPENVGRAAHSDGPNVILITLDTVRADHLSVYGYERDTAPFLRRLAATSTNYTRAIASGDMTLSTHASIFTGLNISRHGAHSSAAAPSGAPLAGDALTLTELLRDQGYETIGVVANLGYLAPEFGFEQGFGLYDCRPPSRFLELGDPFLLRRGVRNAMLFLAGGGLAAKWYRTAEEMNRATLGLLERDQASEQSFFLFLNYMDAHGPYLPPPPYDRQFPGKIDGIWEHELDEAARSVLRLERKLTPAEHGHFVSQYDGEIAYLDAQLEYLFTRLSELGLYDDSLIIVTSDHGEAFGEHDLVDHGVSVYQDQVHIPLIIKFPGQTRGEVVEDLVSVIDLMPTILDTLGLEAPSGLDGDNLRHLDPSSPRILVSESFPAGELLALHPRFNRTQRALFVGSLKLVASDTGERELYDLAEDPWELMNLYSQRGEEADIIESALEVWIRDNVPQSMGPADLSPETLERLRALGYIQ